MRRRIAWLDSAKGLGIIALLLFHAPGPQRLMDYISSFNMPLFFVISGYLFSLKKYEPADFLKRRIRSLVVPYFIFCAALLAFWVVFENLSEGKGLPDIPAAVSAIVYSCGQYMSGKDMIAVAAPLWFVTCLFVVEVGFFWLKRLLPRPRQVVLALLPLSIAGFLLADGRVAFRMPWGIDIALTAIVFYAAGYATGNISVPIAPRSPALKLIAAVAALAAGAGFCALNGPVSYNNMIYHNYFLLYLAAFGGIIGYALIAQLLHEFKPLLFLGRNTLLIFGFHLAGYHVINRILRFARVSTDLTVLWGFAYAAACVALLLPLIYFLNRYLPFAVGKQKQRPASEFAEVKAK